MVLILIPSACVGAQVAASAAAPPNYVLVSLKVRFLESTTLLSEVQFCRQGLQIGPMARVSHTFFAP